MKTIIDKDACVGCNLCADSCPAVFKMDDDKAVVIVDVVPNGQENCAKEAADNCPVTAISIQE